MALMFPYMPGRPKAINPQGDLERLVVLVPVPVAERLAGEAKTEGVTVAQLVRTKLEEVA
jgi:hypothetical protein